MAALGPEFYVDEDAAREEGDRRSSFDAIHQPTVLKADFFVLGERPFDRAQLERRRHSPEPGESGRRVFVSSAEDLILRKLDWDLVGGAGERDGG